MSEARPSHLDDFDLVGVMGDRVYRIKYPVRSLGVMMYTVVVILIVTRDPIHLAGFPIVVIGVGCASPKLNIGNGCIDVRQPSQPLAPEPDACRPRPGTVDSAMPDVHGSHAARPRVRRGYAAGPARGRTFASAPLVRTRWRHARARDQVVDVLVQCRDGVPVSQVRQRADRPGGAVSAARHG